MSRTPTSIYSLLPAVFRANDALQGGQLQALFAVLESQYGIVLDNLDQLYDDQFIETCAPWVIPYIGQLIGYNPVYTVSLSGPDSRAEVANTIGYRRRKGTLIALEQVTQDVSGRVTMAVEEFKRLITTLSLRDVRACNYATADLRCGGDLEGQGGPFTRLNRSIDVRRIGPRNRLPQSPDLTPLEIALHGGGRFNIPDVAVWMWRWQSWSVTKAPAFELGDGGYFFSSLGGPAPLFQSPAQQTAPFQKLASEASVPEPISLRSFAKDVSKFYPSSVELFADGKPVDATQIIGANLAELADGKVCAVPKGKIAIDPVLGRIQYAAGMKTPEDLRVRYNYGSAAHVGGGPYDRSTSITLPNGGNAPTWVIGSAKYKTLEAAVDAWNKLPAGSSAVIVLPNFESYAMDLTGAHAIQIPAESQLLIAAAEVAASDAPPLWTRSCVTLRGDIEIVAPAATLASDGVAPPMGTVQISGIRLCGELRLMGEAASVQVADSTLVPGRALTAKGDAAQPGEPSVSGNAIGAALCLTRVITGPIALPASCSLRINGSIVDAGSMYCPAIAGPDLAGAGASLHIEDSTVIGRVWAQQIRLASNTIFYARLARRDPWKAAVWAQRAQTGCVRFCWLPAGAITPRTYECLAPNATSPGALEPAFITLRFGLPGYCLLSGDAPLAIWKGADNGSQMGVYLQIQETEAVTNIQIRTAEYLPVNLESGVFLIPSRTLPEKIESISGYGYAAAKARCKGNAETVEDVPIGIGIGLL